MIVSLLDGTNQVTNIDLGLAERATDSGWQPLHQRFGKLVGAIGLSPDDGKLHLYDIKQDKTAEELTIPSSPCTDDAKCGTESRLVWAEPLGGDDYLAFWVVNIAPEPGIEQVIYSAKVTAKRAGMTGGMGNAFEIAHPEAYPAGEIDIACIKAAGLCGLDIGKCWDRIAASYPLVRSGPIQKFLDAVATGDCIAIKTLYDPDELLLGCTNGQCVGNSIATNCSIGFVEDCDLHGTQCMTLPGGFKGCGTSGIAVSCNTCSGTTAIRCINGGVIEEDCAVEYGLDCVSGMCTDTSTPRCENNIAYGGGGVGNRMDCSLENLTCAMRNGAYGCLPPKDQAPGCYFDSQCVGSILGFCLPGSGIKWVDCKAIGFSSCVQLNDRAMCQ
jgi:hypothetical protein